MMTETAREEYVKAIRRIRLKQAERAFVLRSLSTDVQYGDEVLVYRATTGRWEPRAFVSRNVHHIFVLEPSGETQPYPKTKVSSFKERKNLPGPDLYGILPEVQAVEDDSKLKPVPSICLKNK